MTPAVAQQATSVALASAAVSTVTGSLFHPLSAFLKANFILAASLRPISVLVVSLTSLHVPAQQAPAQALHPAHQQPPQPPPLVAERPAQTEPVVDLRATFVDQANAAVNMVTGSLSPIPNL